MTEPTTTSTADTTTSSVTSTATAHRAEFGVRREVQDPSRGHLPLTVWLATADTESIPTCVAGCCHPVSGPLACHLIAACARPGETVVHLGARDHQLVSAALTAGCLPVAAFTDAARAGVIWTRLARTHPTYDLEVTDLRITDLDDDEVPLADLAGSAGLVVAEQICDQPSRHLAYPGSGDGAKAYGIASAAGLVKPGGHLAVVTGLHRQARVVDPLPEIIAQARQVGLVYLQHIIALRQPARGERIDPGLGRHGLAALHELPEHAGLSASVRAHSDVLLFTRPRGLSEPHGPEALSTGSAESPTYTESTTQAGGDHS